MNKYNIKPGADLRAANLQYADLQVANLQGANLQGTNLQGAGLQGANLQDADLQGANLQDTDLRGADLWGADLRGADLRGANLQDADLQGARLLGANLHNTQTQRIYGHPWEITVYPTDLTIGCERHSLVEWDRFTNEEIQSMNESALSWWKEWKTMITAIAQKVQNP